MEAGPSDIMRADAPLAMSVVAAIRSGDVPQVRRLIADHPGLAAIRLEAPDGIRSLLHVATEWPGSWPNGPDVASALVEGGADVDARFSGSHRETPLHWAASSDDVAMVDALLRLGADLDARGGVIGDGTPLADAVAFGQWQAARRLVERGARVNLWQAAALGMLDLLRDLLAVRPPPSPGDVTNAFWCACHGGRRDTAEVLLDHGAQLNWVGHDGLTALDAAQRSGAGDLAAWLRARGARRAAEPA